MATSERMGDGGPVEGAVLSETQQKVMRFVCRRAGCARSSVQIAAYGRAHWLSACRALERKGLMCSYRTGHYALTDAGWPIAEQLVAEWKATKEPQA